MKQRDGLPREPRIRYRFKTKPFDFMFQWIAGMSRSGGVEIGELMYLASQIKEGDGESWYRAFYAMGERVSKRAEESLSTGNLVSAEESLLRGYTYYRAAPLFLNPRNDERYKAAYEKGRDRFKKTLGLPGSSMREISVPFETSALPGYIASEPGSPADQKTLLMIGGGDTFVEDLYYYIVPAAVRRGYRVVIVDLPGQGALPYQGLYMRHDAEIPVARVLDYLEAEEGFGLDKVAIYGISGGGYLAPRAAAHEKRIKALVACSVILSLEEVWSQDLLWLRKRPIGRALRLLKPALLDSVLNLVDTYRWRWGATNNEELLRVSSEFVLDPAEISCPTLNLVAQQEYEDFGATRRWALQCNDRIQNPNRKLLVTPANEGADTHAVGTNLSLMSQLVFDWLDDIL